MSLSPVCAFTCFFVGEQGALGPLCGVCMTTPHHSGLETHNVVYQSIVTTVHPKTFEEGVGGLPTSGCPSVFLLCL